MATVKAIQKMAGVTQAQIDAAGGNELVPVMQDIVTGEQIYKDGTVLYSPVLNQVSASSTNGTVVPTGGALGRRLTLLPDSGQSMTVETLGAGGGVTQTFSAITSHTEFVTEAADSAVVVYGFGTYSLI